MTDDEVDGGKIPTAYYFESADTLAERARCAAIVRGMIPVVGEDDDDGQAILRDFARRVAEDMAKEIERGE
jgi:hypothetical protein